LNRERPAASFIIFLSFLHHFDINVSGFKKSELSCNMIIYMFGDMVRFSMQVSETPLPYDLKGHVALVTGANHGIGAATARALSSCGASILVSYLRMSDPEDFPEPYRSNRAKGADDVLASIRASGGRAGAMEANLKDAGAPARLFDFAEAELGPVDILVNNATGWTSDTFAAGGLHAAGPQMVRVSEATHEQVFSVDAHGGALMISEFARRHIERRADWGRIIGLTSGGPLGFPNEVSYGAAKAALENYTMSAAFELAPFGITANIVYPPVTDTGWLNETIREGVKQRPDLIHIVGPDDVAEVIAFLCSDHARFVTANIVHLR
jgi:3-oxoacyl-[acyl-carrier protein] reductase